MLTSPQVEYYIECYSNNFAEAAKLNDVSRRLLLRLFDVVKPIKNYGTGETVRKKFYFYAPKGTFDQYRALYKDENEASLRKWFESESDRWYEVNFQYLKTPWHPEPYYGVYINDFYVLSLNDKNERGSEIDAADFILDLIKVSESVMSELRNGEYNKRISESLPDYMRYGKISRSEYWDAFPEEREKYSFTERELEALREANGKITSSPPTTAREFYEMCAICYESAGCKPASAIFEDTEEEHVRYKGVTPKEMYYRYADGRDDGLSLVDLDDKEEFKRWLHHEEPYTYKGGHPFEIIFSFSGLSSIHLYVNDEEVVLTFGKYPANVTAAKMFIGLKDKGFDVCFNPESILTRIDEKDDIGVLPYYDWSSSHFDNVLDCINPTTEEYEKLKGKIQWEPIPEVLLDEE